MSSTFREPKVGSFVTTCYYIARVENGKITGFWNGHKFVTFPDNAGCYFTLSEAKEECSYIKEDYVEDEIVIIDVNTIISRIYSCYGERI